MELNAEDRQALVPDALVRAVVGVAEPGRPAGGEAGRVDGEAVVLAGDIAALRALLEAGLVLAAMAELELVSPASGGQGQKLVAEADAEEGDALGQEPADGGHRGRRPGRVARPVGDDDPARGEIEDAARVRVGRDADDGDAAPCERADDPHLDAAVDEDDGLAGLGMIDADLRRRDLGHEVAGVGIGDGPGLAAETVGAERAVGDGEQAGHDSVDPELLRQGPGVDAGDPRDAVLAEPVVKRLPRRGVGGGQAELRDDVTGDPGPLGLERRRIDAVVADERVGLAEDLAVIGRVGDALGIAHDPGVENDFPPDLGVGAETYAFEDGPVREGQNRSANALILRRIFRGSIAQAPPGLKSRREIRSGIERQTLMSR